MRCISAAILAAGTISLVAMCGSLVRAQTVDVRVSVNGAPTRPFASNVIVPQARSFNFARGGTAEITSVDAVVSILEQTATTTLDVSLKNPGGARLEAELVVPVPDGAVVKGFAFEGKGAEPTAVLLPKDESRRTYEQIVSKMRDPAMLEFLGYNLVRSSVFPVEAHGMQKVRLIYEQLLTVEGNRVDYVLPRSESVLYTTPWHVTADIKSKRPISTVYSPTHAFSVDRIAANRVKAKTVDAASTEPGPFRLSWILEEDGVTATMFAYPEADGGYFLLLAGLPAAPRSAGADGIRRDVTLVFDRSGSMHGEKLDQVREAAVQIISGLDECETFNIIAYNESVTPFSASSVAATKENRKAAEKFLKSMESSGGTNIYDALGEALRLKPRDDSLGIVLFLTDGLPTVGQTSETAIRDMAARANKYERRIFTFGVGCDVNTPLLEEIASRSRAAATFVLPNEDVEAKVGQVFKRLSGPILASAEIESVSKGTSGPRVRDILPAKLPDLFEGDQLVLLGRYTGSKPLSFKLSGNYLGGKREFTFSFSLDKATTRNSFVPRLWASRRIAALVAAIRQLGADDGRLPPASAAASDPRLKELVDEIVHLSTEYGILTEYTAFLAREGTDLSNRDAVLAAANANLENRAMRARVGVGSVNQSINSAFQGNQAQLNYRNSFYDQTMQRSQTVTIQQVSDRAFFQRGNRWVDSRVVARENKARPDTVVEFGSEEWKQLAGRLASEGRQGTLSLRGDVLLMVDDKLVLVKGSQEK
jgi:Ca-activated chloride channel homolog